MQRLPRLTILFLSLFAAPLDAQEKAATPEKKPEEKLTYVDHILPIFRARCGACHNASDRRGGLILDQYGAMLEGGSSGSVIEPGDGEISYLWMLVNHEDTPKMPPNADKLPESELAMIRKWIDLGALENAGSMAKIKKKASLAKIEVSTARPSEVAMPLSYLGEPKHVASSTNSVTALSTSPWAPMTAVSGFQQIGLYHSKTLASLGTLDFPEGQPQILKFSRNGALLMAGGGRGGQLGKVVVFDVKTGERKTEVGNEYDQVLAADISPDQSRIALGGPKKMLRVYSTATGELLYESKKHTDWITAIEFSPDGVLLASGDRSNGLIVWEADSGNLFYDLLGHKGSVNDISWRPDSNVVGSASEDGTIKLWEMQNGGNIKSWNAHGGGASAMDYTREGNIVSVGRDKVARLWDGNGTKLKDFAGLADIGMEVAYDAETQRVFAGDWTGVIQVWNSADAAKVGEINTNPPTLEMALATLEPQLQQLRDAHVAKVKTLADLNKKVADRKVLADNAVAAATKAKAAADQATALKNAAMTDVTSKKTISTTSQQAVLATKAESDKTMAAAQTAQQEFVVAKTKLDQQTAQLNQSKAAAQTATEGAAKMAESYQFTLKAAEPTPEEQAVIEKDAAVQAAVEKRKALVKEAEANLTLVNLYSTKAQAALQASEAALATVTQTHSAKNAAAVAANAAAQKAAAAAAAAVQAQSVAQQNVVAAEANLAKLIEAETTAVALMATTKAEADKLVAAAQPTADEQKAIQAAQAEATAAEAELKALEERVTKMKSIQSQVASATTKSE